MCNGGEVFSADYSHSRQGYFENGLVKPIIVEKTVPFLCQIHQKRGHFLAFLCIFRTKLKSRDSLVTTASVERGRQDLNPRHSVLETDVLPLNYYPIGTNSTLFP